MSVVQPAIREALARTGRDPDTQIVDVVAHSTGGLLMRYLVEHPVASWAAQVPTESPFMTGAAIDTFGYLHGRLLPAEPVIDLIVKTLRASPVS